MSQPSLAPGARALAAALLIGLAGVLVGRAIWADDGTAVTPAITQGTASAKPPPASGSTDLDSVIAGSASGLGSCLSDVAGSPAPPDELQASDQEQFITILSGQLQQLRELDFRHPVDAQFLSGPQIEARIGRLLDKEPLPADQSQAGAKVLTALGAIDSGDDPAKIQRQALQGQVAGLYVPKTGELLVRSGDQVSVTDTITVVHELDHALTDQALGGIREKFGKATDAGERQSAYSALVEGDATITMEAYLLRHGSVNDQLDMLSELGPASKAQADLETYPYYFQRQLLFPYLDGLQFDCALYEKGGWKAVDKAYRDPPKTTAEVMFPERYGERPAAVPPSPSLSSPWKKQLSTTIGAADLEWLFAAPGDDTSKALDDPRAAASAWDGGRVELWTRGPDTAVSLSLNDRGGDLGLCDSIERWYGAFGGSETGRPSNARFSGGDTNARIVCNQHHVALGIGPTSSVARLLAPQEIASQLSSAG